MRISDIPLLPCPFCGGKAELMRHSGCMLFKAACAGQSCIGSYIFKWHDTPERAAAAWNGREGKDGKENGYENETDHGRRCGPEATR